MILQQEDHPVTLWLRRQLPGTGAVRSSYRRGLPLRRVQRPIAAGRTVVRWDLLGNAIDQRLRCAFAAPGPSGPVAAGVERAGHLGGAELRDLGLDLLQGYLELVQREHPSHRENRWVLDPEAEARLDRFCFAGAWFERVYRDGVISPLSPLAGPDRPGGREQLLARVPQYAVLDLEVQVRLAESALAEIRSSTTEAVCLAGPIFLGGRDVGGADGDLIIDHLLLDVKSTSRPEFLSDSMIYQLAGYAILDYEDEYEIHDLGFYLSRIGWLKTWPIEEFLRLLGCRSSMPQLRTAFVTEFGSGPGP
jgi:hypothetical protein